MNELIKQNPKSFDALFEKGRILQAWAETDPKCYAEAIDVWTTLRTALARQPQKTPEYYEVVYNAAFCLVSQASIAKDAQKIADARQLLKTTMTLSPSLSGPDMVTKYKALLEKCRFLQEHQL